MKNLKLYIVVVSVISLASCDSFLESSSKSVFTEKTVYENLDYTRQAVWGCYFYLIGGSDGNQLWGARFNNYLCGTDVESSFQGNDASGVYAIPNYAANPGNNNCASLWDNLYSLIERCNMLIDNLPSSPLWNDLNLQYETRWIYGEAVCMRAYAFYMLIGFFGDVPFPQKATSTGDNLYLPKTNRDEIYDACLQQLLDVQEYMPWMMDARDVRRMTKGFAKGLRAKMALMAGGYSLRGESENFVTRTPSAEKRRAYYEIARQECQEIMASGKHLLKPDYLSIFKDLLKYQSDYTYGEVIFELPFSRLNSGRVGSQLGLQIVTEHPKYGSANAEVSLPMHHFFTYDRADIRRDINAEVFDYRNTDRRQHLVQVTTGWRTSKWRRYWIDPNMGIPNQRIIQTGCGFPLLRYTDIVLLFAEAENELNGPTQAARDALASIRKRAFNSQVWPQKVTRYVDSVAVSKDMFFNALVDERSWEFSGELVRKFDLIRWNLLAAKKKQMWDLTWEIFKAVDDNSRFGWVPREIFVRDLPDGESLEVLNRDYRFPYNSVQPGWSRAEWAAGLSDGQQNNYVKDFLNVTMDALDNIPSWEGGMNNYLQPIAQRTLDAAQGVLKQDHWRNPPPTDANRRPNPNTVTTQP